MTKTKSDTKAIRLGTTHPRIRESSLARLDVDSEEKHAPNGEPFDEMFIFSTERLASDGGVIYVDGWRTDQYALNPRFISNHDAGGMKSPTIVEQAAGKTVDTAKRNDLPHDLTMNGKGLVGWVRFAPTSFGRDVRLLYAEGHLRACSVRWDWQTEEVRHPFEDEARLYGDDLFWVVTRADLMECSAVILGADPGALTIRGRDELGTPQFDAPSRLEIRKDAVEAFQRCRAKGHDMRTMERLMRQVAPSLPVLIEGRANVDSGALSSALQGFDEALDMFDALMDQVPNVRESLAASRAELEALTAGDSDSVESGETETEDTDDEEERSMADVTREIENFSKVLNGLGEAVEKMTASVNAVAAASETEDTLETPASNAEGEELGEAGEPDAAKSDEDNGDGPEPEASDVNDESAEDEETEAVVAEQEGDTPEDEAAAEDADGADEVTDFLGQEDLEEEVDLEAIFANA